MNTPSGYNATLEFEMCRQHYYWSNECIHPSQLALPPSERQLGLVPLEKSKALAVGTCYHRAVEELDRTGDPDRAFLTFDAAWEAEVLAFENLADDTDEVRNLGRKMLTSYLTAYRTDPLETIALEHPFDLELEPGAHFTGKIDKLAVYHGLLLVVERKTTSDTPAQFFPRFALDRSISGYTWAANNDPALADYRTRYGKVAGVLVEACGKPRTRTGECWNMREVYLRTQDELDLWKEEQLSILRDIERCRSGLEPWRRTTAWCENWAGYHRTCVFKPLCMSTPDNVSGVIEHGYAPKDWKENES